MPVFEMEFTKTFRINVKAASKEEAFTQISQGDLNDWSLDADIWEKDILGTLSNSSSPDAVIMDGFPIAEQDYYLGLLNGRYFEIDSEDINRAKAWDEEWKEKLKAAKNMQKAKTV